MYSWSTALCLIKLLFPLNQILFYLFSVKTINLMRETHKTEGGGVQCVVALLLEHHLYLHLDCFLAELSDIHQEVTWWQFHLAGEKH